jgi:hypothetical protein
MSIGLGIPSAEGLVLVAPLTKREPMRVYHLLTGENALSDLSLRRIRISRFADLNDPFELLAAKTGERRFRKGLRSWRDDFNQSHGLLCFSKSWENPVLWSHYGEKHQGVCLGFDVADDLIEEVQYAKDRLPIRFVEGNPEKGLDESFVRDLLRTKYMHWQYEEEVRVRLKLAIQTIENGSYFYPFGRDLALREVILGPLCEIPIDRVREDVRAAYQNVSVIKARLAFKCSK